MISGVLVASQPEHLEAVILSVDAIPWADVHYFEPDGRLVVTVEANGVDDSIERLGELERLPNVLSATLAEYRFEEDEL